VWNFALKFKRLSSKCQITFGLTVYAYKRAAWESIIIIVSFIACLRFVSLRLSLWLINNYCDVFQGWTESHGFWPFTSLSARLSVYSFCGQAHREPQRGGRQGNILAGPPNIFAGPPGEFFFKMVHFCVFYIFERRQGPQTLRGPG